MPKGKRIGYYRADSASYQSELINQLEEDKVLWAITADLDKAVKAFIGEIHEKQWQEPEKGCGYEIADTLHSMNNTRQAFRLVIKRELRKQSNLINGGILKNAPNCHLTRDSHFSKSGFGSDGFRSKNYTASV